MAKSKSILRRVVKPTFPLPKRKLNDLVRVYGDLEKTLKTLKRIAQAQSEASLHSIDVKKLISQLVRSKRKLEKKISNTLLLEKQHLKRRLNTLASQFTHDRT